jgi:hypothetical protein
MNIMDRDFFICVMMLPEVYKIDKNEGQINKSALHKLKDEANKKASVIISKAKWGNEL